MQFILHKDEFGGVVNVTWELQSSKGTPICRSVEQEDGHDFHSEKDARSDIARAKVSMKGARFAKVVSDG